MTACAVVGCPVEYDVAPILVTVKAPTTSSVSQPRIEFEAELCVFHREPFDSKKHTVLASTSKIRERA